MKELIVTVAGPVHSGKTTVLSAIDYILRQAGAMLEYQGQDRDQYMRLAADWFELQRRLAEMIKDGLSVTLKEATTSRVGSFSSKLWAGVRAIVEDQKPADADLERIREEFPNGISWPIQVSRDDGSRVTFQLILKPTGEM